jgi:hypothetical protein
MTVGVVGLVCAVVLLCCTFKLYETTLTILVYIKPHIVLAFDLFTVQLPEDGPNGPKHVGVLKYLINIRKAHLLEVVIYNKKHVCMFSFYSVFCPENVCRNIPRNLHTFLLNQMAPPSRLE